MKPRSFAKKWGERPLQRFAVATVQRNRHAQGIVGSSGRWRDGFQCSQVEGFSFHWFRHPFVKTQPVDFGKVVYPTILQDFWHPRWFSWISEPSTVRFQMIFNRTKVALGYWWDETYHLLDRIWWVLGHGNIRWCQTCGCNQFPGNWH